MLLIIFDSRRRPLVKKITIWSISEEKYALLSSIYDRSVRWSVLSSSRKLRPWGFCPSLRVWLRVHVLSQWTASVGVLLGLPRSIRCRRQVFISSLDQCCMDLLWNCKPLCLRLINRLTEVTVWHIFDRRGWSRRSKLLRCSLWMLMPYRQGGKRRSGGRRILVKTFNRWRLIRLDVIGASVSAFIISMSLPFCGWHCVWRYCSNVVLVSLPTLHNAPGGVPSHSYLICSRMACLILWILQIFQ